MNKLNSSASQSLVVGFGVTYDASYNRVNSPGHYWTMVAERYNNIGVGVTVDKRHRLLPYVCRQPQQRQCIRSDLNQAFRICATVNKIRPKGALPLRFQMLNFLWRKLRLADTALPSADFMITQMRYSLIPNVVIYVVKP